MWAKRTTVTGTCTLLWRKRDQPPRDLDTPVEYGKHASLSAWDRGWRDNHTQMSSRGRSALTFGLITIGEVAVRLFSSCISQGYNHSWDCVLHMSSQGDQDPDPGISPPRKTLSWSDWMGKVWAISITVFRNFCRCILLRNTGCNIFNMARPLDASLGAWSYHFVDGFLAYDRGSEKFDWCA